MNILIIIPAYNEFENIINLINDINKIKNFNINLLVVDDSTDFKIYKLIKENQYKNVEYINRGSKLGRGSAVRFGFEYAIKKNFDCIFEMDADYSHNPNEIIHLIKQMVNNKYDMVIASRYLKDSKIEGWPIKRKIFSKLANLLARLLFSFKIKDYTNGFRIYSLRAIKKIVEYDINNSGFIYLTETLVILLKNNYKISEFPSKFNNRTFGKSSVSVSEIFTSLIGIIKIKIQN